MTEPRATVLVVDDEESMRYFLEKTLAREGYRVVAAPDGPSALSEARSQPPDVALLDVRMPGMDGVTLMRALHATQPDLPVVLMTAFGSVQSALQAMKQGASDYVTKPFRVDAIRTTVARTLERARRGDRPPTVRAMVPEESSVDAPPAEAPAPAARTVPGPRFATPPRGVAAFLRERAEERGLPLDASPPATDHEIRQVVRLCELVFVDELLDMTQGNVSRAAELAGITRPNMHRKVLDLGLSADDYRHRRGRRDSSEAER